MGDARKLNEKRHIGYGVIGSGTIPGCGPKKPNAAACKKTPANNYNRGCSFGTRCRRHPPALDTCKLLIKNKHNQSFHFFFL